MNKKIRQTSKQCIFLKSARITLPKWSSTDKQTSPDFMCLFLFWRVCQGWLLFTTVSDRLDIQPSDCLLDEMLVSLKWVFLARVRLCLLWQSSKWLNMQSNFWWLFCANSKVLSLLCPSSYWFTLLNKSPEFSGSSFEGKGAC